MQLKPISTLAGVTTIAAVALLTIFLVRQKNAPQPSEMFQPAASKTPTTAAPIESQVPAQDQAVPRKPDAPREARRKQAHVQTAALDSGWLSLALNPAPLDYRIAVPEAPPYTATTSIVEESVDTSVPVSETGESNDYQSVLATTQVPQESDVLTHESGRASTLLAEIQREAADLRLHAEVLGTYGRNPQRNWKSHAYYLARVKHHINAVGERTTELQQISYAVLPWQQQAISEVTAHAAQLAASTRAAIVHLRENQNRLHFGSEYRDHLMTIDDRSEDLKQTVDKYLDYEETQQKLQKLQNELEL